MDTPVLTVYRELADHYERLGQSSMRDRFLMLAADAAFSAEMTDEAERLRQRLLTGNRHHMLRPYNTFEEATRAADVQAYLEGLRANYPPEQARDLLNALRGGDDLNSLPPSPLSAPPPPASRAIPMTSPLLDLNTREPSRPETSRPFQPKQPEPAPRTSRPRAQPAPPPAQPATAPTIPPPSRSVPVVEQTQPLRFAPLEETPQPKKKEPPHRAAPAPAPAPRRPVAEPRVPPESAGSAAWFNVTLTVLAATVGLALVAFALARPFLPSGLLP